VTDDECEKSGRVRVGTIFFFGIPVWRERVPDNAAHSVPLGNGFLAACSRIRVVPPFPARLVLWSGGPLDLDLDGKRERDACGGYNCRRGITLARRSTI
jgi:hypothetical protein